MKCEKKTLENSLVWSAHRASTVGRCELKYYYNYVGSWEGWQSDAPPEVQDAYRLKHLTTPDLEIGQILHGQIKGIFEKVRSKRNICPATEVKIAQEKFKAFVQQSARRPLDSCTAKCKKLLLHEHGETLSPSRMDSYCEKIAAYFDGFFGFEDVQLLLADPSVLLPDFLDPAGFEIDHYVGAPARLKTDAVHTSLDKLVICDWKCGAPSDDHRSQGLTYDIFVRNKLMLPTTDVIEVRFFYLGAKQMVPYIFSEEEREERLWEIGEQYETLKSYSEDSKINTAPRERFHARPSNACHFCNHAQMCESFLRSRFNDTFAEVA
jgi:PD-(D/E)XK nuclease superfamily